MNEQIKDLFLQIHNSQKEILEKSMEIKELTEKSIMFAGIYHDVQIYSGIEELAKIIGVEVYLRTLDDKDYPAEQYFYYDGIKYLQLVRRDL